MHLSLTEADEIRAERITLFWDYRLAAKIPGCLPGDWGSIPHSLVTYFSDCKMTKATLLKTVPAPVRSMIRRNARPSKAVLKSAGYSINTNGVYKWVAIHDTHVLKFSRTPRMNCVVEREVAMYNTLTREQKRLAVPMFLVGPSMSIAPRVLAHDPRKHETTMMNSIALGLRQVWETMGVEWTDDHYDNVGFMLGRDYPIVIDLDFLVSTR